MDKINNQKYFYKDDKFFIKITKAKILPNIYLKDFYSEELGAYTTFIGTIRDTTEDNKKIIKLYYEANISMAISEMLKILKKYENNFNKAIVIHRIGELKPKEIAIFIALSNKHRDNIFIILSNIVEEIKKTVPIWKKEYFEGGSKWKDT
jgi:molybdopterin synthase catalytic subunit